MQIDGVALVFFDEGELHDEGAVFVVGAGEAHEWLQEGQFLLAVLAGEVIEGVQEFVLEDEGFAFGTLV
jgi:hypothetical protein